MAGVVPLRPGKLNVRTAMNNRRSRTSYILVPQCLSVLFLLLFVATPLASAQGGRIVREKIHSPSLEKTVTGESPDRNVSIYLPPGYDKSPSKR